MKLASVAFISAVVALLAHHQVDSFQSSHHAVTFHTATNLKSDENPPVVSQFAPRSISNTALFSATKNAQSSDEPELDVDALFKYASAGAVQMGCFYALLNALDLGVTNLNLDMDVPIWANGLFFYACSLKSRVFNPLNNKRPQVDNIQGGERIRPSWTPPGVFFPIMWLLIIGPIRAYSSALVVDAAGEYANIATLSFLLHLSVGDVWNTINNVEKRLGAAASGVVLVVLSAANAAYQYYQLDPNAGELLALTLLWLTTAGVLVNSIWQLNPDSVSGERDALFPVKGDIKTEFAWFGSKAD
jgi:benzodiazapine receptor